MARFTTEGAKRIVDAVRKVEQMPVRPTKPNSYTHWGYTGWYAVIDGYDSATNKYTFTYLEPSDNGLTASNDLWGSGECYELNGNRSVPIGTKVWVEASRTKDYFFFVYNSVTSFYTRSYTVVPSAGTAIDTSASSIVYFNVAEGDYCGNAVTNLDDGTLKIKEAGIYQITGSVSFYNVAGGGSGGVGYRITYSQVDLSLSGDYQVRGSGFVISSGIDTKSTVHMSGVRRFAADDIVQMTAEISYYNAPYGLCYYDWFLSGIKIDV